MLLGAVDHKHNNQLNSLSPDGMLCLSRGKHNPIQLHDLYLFFTRLGARTLLGAPGLTTRSNVRYDRSKGHRY